VESVVGGSVAIVGGGVIGMAIALEVAPSVRDCILIDPSPGRGASWAAAGMLSAAAEIAPGEEGLLEDLKEAAAIWPAFAERVTVVSDVDIGFARSSSVLAGATQSDVREVERVAKVIRAAGARVEPLQAEALTAIEPALGARLHGGWLLPADYRVDNRLFVEALLEAVKSVGVRIVEDRCEHLERTRTSIRLGLSHQGTLDVDRCVIATGAWAPFRGTENLGLPTVRPVRGTTLRLGAAPGVEVPTRTVRAVVDSMHCYLVPRTDGSLVVGATSEEQGYDTVSPAGGVFRLLEGARAVFPGIDELIFEEAAVGLRPATPDHLPFVGAADDSRIIGAIGHYRNGLLLSPLAARRAASLLLS